MHAYWLEIWRAWLNSIEIHWVSMWLPCFEDVDAEYERLSKLDVPFPTSEPMTFSFGIRNFYVADPEGNLLEIGSTNEA